MGHHNFRLLLQRRLILVAEFFIVRCRKKLASSGDQVDHVRVGCVPYRGASCAGVTSLVADRPGDERLHLPELRLSLSRSLIVSGK